MKPAIIGLVFVFSLSVASLAEADRITRKIKVDETFTTLDLLWEGEAEGRYVARWTLRRVDGIIEMCGIGLRTTPGIKKVLLEKQRTAELLVNGEPILKDIRFFAKARSVEELKRGKALCRSSGVEAFGAKARVVLQIAK